MKNLLLLCLSIFGFFACNDAPKNTTVATAPQTMEKPADAAASQNAAELVAITGVIHGFYAWYGKFQSDEKRNIDFTKAKGKHLVLDEAKLDQYFDLIKGSGFISDDFIANEKVIMKKCAVLWQKENIDEPPSCLDGDRYFCSQDWDVEFWTKGPVKAEGLGTDKVMATMSGTEGNGSGEMKFELKKENGKWLISRIECDMGI